MAKMFSELGQIERISFYGQVIGGFPYISYFIDANPQLHPSQNDCQINEEIPLMFYVHFNSIKSFVDQMTFNEGTLLGITMREVFERLNLK